MQAPINNAGDSLGELEPIRGLVIVRPVPALLLSKEEYEDFRRKALRKGPILSDVLNNLSRDKVELSYSRSFQNRQEFAAHADDAVRDYEGVFPDGVTKLCFDFRFQRNVPRIQDKWVEERDYPPVPS